MRRGTIAMVVSGFPRRSETFLLGEAAALDDAGLLGPVFATKAGDAGAPQPKAGRLARRVHYLASGDADGQAAEVVQRLGGEPTAGIHAYFAHFPAEVAARAAARLGLPFGFSVHARDARKVAAADLAARARRAACVVACNADVVSAFDGSGVQVPVVPHGVDLDVFHPRPQPSPEPLRLLAVGRLVAKKGFDVLVDAVARLRVAFHLRIVGEGPRQDLLRAAIAAAGLGERVELCGARTHADLPAEYGSAHVIVAPSIEDHTGDRDGLPNVVLEAMASARPVVASAIGAIPSAVADGRTGLLCAPGDAAGLAAALERLARAPGLRAHLGAQARALVVREFDVRQCSARLARLLASAYA